MKNICIKIEITVKLKILKEASKTKPVLLQKRYFFPHPFICKRNFISKKVGNQKKLRPPDIIKVGLVSSISNFFINKILHAKEVYIFSGSKVLTQMKKLQKPQKTSSKRISTYKRESEFF